MYNFVQYNPNKKGSWVMVDEKAELKKRPAFKTILKISTDPAQFVLEGMDPENYVTYLGPMYFDLDGPQEKRQEVIETTQEIVSELTDKYHIPQGAIKVYLSGKKGTHVTVDERVFGVTKPLKILPIVWGKFADRFDNDYTDKSVYSLGKGRMWRQTQVKRADNGRYKVQISHEELRNLTVDTYDQLTSTSRPDFQEPTAEDVKEVPKLKSMIDAMFLAAKKELKELRKASENVTVEDLQNIEGIPGCIEILITQGDCESSNWNQAAMQLAGYIAGKYDRDEDKDEYMSKLVTPFVENVSSSSRPTEQERLSHMRDQLRRAFSGNTKFLAGGIIRTIGTACGSCVICKGPVGEEINKAKGKPGVVYNKEYGILIEEQAIWSVSGKDKKKICSAGIKPDVLYSEVNDFGEDVVVDGEYIFNYRGVKRRALISEQDFQDRQKFKNIASDVQATFFGNERELQKLYATLLEIRDSVNIMRRSETCGIRMDKKSDGKVIPHLILASESYKKGRVPSDWVYSGPRNMGIDLDWIPDFVSEDEVELADKTIRNLFKINEPRVIIPAIGWTVACALKAHLTLKDKSFPMLNLSGSSETGKSATAYLLLALNGNEYRNTQVFDAEVGTIYPLENMVTTSTTFIRLVEECNEHIMNHRTWSRLTGILKSSWDESGISKGALKGRQTIVIHKDNPAPIMFLSEQSHPTKSVRTRTVECMLGSSTVMDREKVSAHEMVVKNTDILEMLGKVIHTTALNTSLQQVEEWRKYWNDRIPRAYVGRGKKVYSIPLIGLSFLARVMDAYSAEASKLIQDSAEWYISHLVQEGGESRRRTTLSVIDDFLLSIDQMAEEKGNTQSGLLPGEHYWREGNNLYLDLRVIFPRYKRYVRSQGSTSSLRNRDQVMALLGGERYFLGTIQHPDKPGLSLVHISITEMKGKGINISYISEAPLGG